MVELLMGPRRLRVAFREVVRGLGSRLRSRRLGSRFRLLLRRRSGGLVGGRGGLGGSLKRAISEPMGRR